MAKSSFNPLRLFRRKDRSSVSSSVTSELLLKPSAQPRKSGNIFMHLILLQKILQSMNLSLRQQLDSSILVQKAVKQVLLLKLEAETVGEEALAQASGQVLTYFETVKDDRLDLDEEGVAIVHDFAIIFKDALGDAAPGVRALDEKQVGAWESRYQCLMARMRPSIEEAAGLTGLKGTELGDEKKDIVQEDDDTHETAVAGEDEPVDEAPAGTYRPVHVDSSEEETPVDYLDAEEFASASDKGHSTESEELNEEAADEEIAAFDAAEETSAEEVPLYCPAEDSSARDVVIPDAEVKSARERMDLGEPEPKFVGKERETGTPAPERVQSERIKAALTGFDREVPRAPVQLEEVERLKEKLLQLHEKQEMLSSRMDGILGGFKKAVRGEKAREGSPPVEELDIKDLEDLIFIGRRKG